MVDTARVGHRGRPRDGPTPARGLPHPGGWASRDPARGRLDRRPARRRRHQPKVASVSRSPTPEATLAVAALTTLIVAVVGAWGAAELAHVIGSGMGPSANPFGL